MVASVEGVALLFCAVAVAVTDAHRAVNTRALVSFNENMNNSLKIDRDWVGDWPTPKGFSQTLKGQR